ncbi:MAG: DUF2007 domain-containing protein [Cruoricaptor ignavus]|nr:DUF2007 domain-containing protein [Cruoricaptor ignavus]
MDNKTRVSVYESEVPQEIQIVKSKLDEAGIESSIENAYMTFTTTPTATSLKLMVSLQEEKKAFDIIDAYLQQSENN